MKAVGLASKGEHCSRTHDDLSVEASRQMNSQEWEVQVEGRINVTQHQVPSSWFEVSIVAAERNNANISCQSTGKSISVESRTVHHNLSCDSCASRTNGHGSGFSRSSQRLVHRQ